MCSLSYTTTISSREICKYVLRFANVWGMWPLCLSCYTAYRPPVGSSRQWFNMTWLGLIQAVLMLWCSLWTGKATAWGPQEKIIHKNHPYGIYHLFDDNYLPDNGSRLCFSRVNRYIYVLIKNICSTVLPEHVCSGRWDFDKLMLS